VSAFIVDASVAVKWVLPERYSDQAVAVLNSGEPLESPLILPLEFDSVLCRRMRKGEITLEKAEDSRAMLRKLPIRLHPIESLLDSAFSLAAHTNSKPYDCLYVMLAARLGGRMVTADERLFNSLAGSPFAGYLQWIGDVR